MKKLSNEELKTINGGLTACLTLYDHFAYFVWHQTYKGNHWCEEMWIGERYNKPGHYMCIHGK